MPETAQLFTLKELNEDTAGVIRQVHESGQPAIITRHGRFLTIIHPIPDGIESSMLSSYLEDNPLPETTDLQNTDEVNDFLRKDAIADYTVKPESPKVIECPMEYGPRFIKNGVSRGASGECICNAHGETPCGYLATSNGSNDG